MHTFSLRYTESMVSGEEDAWFRTTILALLFLSLSRSLSSCSYVDVKHVPIV